MRASENVPYYRDPARYPLMSRAEEAAVAVRYRETGDPRFAKQLVAANLRIVVKIALETVRKGTALDDLIQEGNLGLMNAVEKYDPARGFKLATYASWWIRAYMFRFVIGNARLVKIGSTQAQRKVFWRWRQVQAALERDGERVDDAVLAKAMGVRTDDVSDMRLRLGRYEASLDDPRRPTDASGIPGTLADTLAAPDSWRPDAVLESKDGDRMRAELAAFRASLAAREADIFDARLAANDETTTLADIADRYGVSRERVRQIEERLRQRARAWLLERMPDLAVHVQTEPAPVPSSPEAKMPRSYTKPEHHAPRRCRVCRSTGHNVQTCPDVRLPRMAS